MDCGRDVAIGPIVQGAIDFILGCEPAKRVLFMLPYSKLQITGYADVQSAADAAEDVNGVAMVSFAGMAFTVIGVLRLRTSPPGANSCCAPNEQICTLRESSGLRLRGDESKSHTLSLFSQVLFAASLLLLLGQREDAFVVGLAGFDQVVEDTS